MLWWHLVMQVHCRPQILQLHGMSLSDFKTHSDALKTADALIKQNKEELGHAGTFIEHELPMLSKFLFLASHGVKRSFSQKEKKEFKVESDIKSAKLLKDSGLFQEGMGAGASSSGDGGPGVKVEHVWHSKVQVAKDSLRLSYIHWGTM